MGGSLRNRISLRQRCLCRLQGSQLFQNFLIKGFVQEISQTLANIKDILSDTGTAFFARRGRTHTKTQFCVDAQAPADDFQIFGGARCAQCLWANFRRGPEARGLRLAGESKPLGESTVTAHAQSKYTELTRACGKL